MQNGESLCGKMEIEGSFRGADEEEDDAHGHEGPELMEITMAGMMKSQGQMALADGSARQTNNADLQRQLILMMNSRGGTTIQPAPFATRPHLEEGHAH